MTICGLAAERLTLKVALTVPLFPSVTVTLLMEMPGPSSSMILAVPTAVAMLALVEFESVTVKLSSISSVVSPLTKTVICLLVWPAEKVSVPL